MGTDMTREEAIETLKENLCAMCPYGSQSMMSCDIRGCDNRDAIKALEQESCEDAVSRKEVVEFLRNHAKDFEDARLRMAFMTASSLVENTNNVPSVTPIHIEQEPVLDKIRAEIIDTLYVDSLIFGELIDFLNGKISADDVIEEFNRVTRLEVLKIIDKYKAESEE